MTETTPQQMIEWLDKQEVFSENAIGLRKTYLPTIRAIRQFIASHQEVREDVIEQCAKLGDAYSDKWDQANGFEGHTAGARIIAQQIRALKGKP